MLAGSYMRRWKQIECVVLRLILKAIRKLSWCVCQRWQAALRDKRLRPSYVGEYRTGNPIPLNDWGEAESENLTGSHMESGLVFSRYRDAPFTLHRQPDQHRRHESVRDVILISERDDRRSSHPDRDSPVRLRDA